MLKQLLSIAVLSTLSISAFAQDEAVQTSQAQMQNQRPSFSEYLMKGFSVGIEYTSLSGSGKVDVKDNDTGMKGSYNISTDRSSAGAGLSVMYANLIRGKAGYMFGLTYLKSTEAKNDKESYLGSSGDVALVRPEMSVAYSLDNGIYGAVGGHLNHIQGLDGGDFLVNRVGIGLQLQVGYVPMQNLAIDLGYYLSNHNVLETHDYDLQGSSFYAVRTYGGSESHINIKQLRARVSYLF